ncbi:unnamed protein product [Caenorhabditis angaria]|uniref:Uncharacterized protein n=1 Tax=Caenorhabditis angaria TaxID=860376 RepID=A0A9P1IXG1_9PELO|nr:unnamed protein product [Caenorhabditis angaria]
MFYTTTISEYMFPEIVSINLLFVTALTTTSIIAMRSFLTILIVVERFWVGLLEENYKKYRSKIKIIFVLMFIVFAGSLDDIMLFFVFKMSFPISPECRSFLCTTPKAYHYFFSIHTIFYGLASCIAAIILIIRFIIFWFKGNTFYIVNVRFDSES